MFVRTGWKRGQRSGRAAIVALAGGLVAGCGPSTPGDTDVASSTGDTSTGPGPDPDPTTTDAPTTDPPTTEPTTDTTGPDATSTSGTTGPDATSTTEPETGTTGPDDLLTCVPGVTLQRRLTNAQYLNTLADLLPGVKLPKLALPAQSVEIEGFDNLADAQLPWAEVSATYAAVAQVVAGAAVVQAELFLPCAPDGGADPAACGAEFLDAFAPRAFRRPLKDDEKALLVEDFTVALAQDGFEAAIQAALATILSSETFLHLVEGAGAPVDGHPDVLALTGFEVAARLSYFLWNSTPDAELLAAAGDGTLDGKEGVEAQARRLLMDPRARGAVARFAIKWLAMQGLEPGNAVPKGVPMQLQASLRGEIERLVGHVVFDGDRTLASLLTTNLGFVNDDLAAIYGVPGMGEELMQTELDPAQRPGLLTRAGWLAMRAFDGHHSPFQRGNQVLERLLCIEFPPIPPDVSLEVVIPDDQTTRQVYEALIGDPTCAGCHEPAHDIGYGLENYDFLGTWQDAENGLPVDASSDFPPLADPDQAGPFTGPVELMGKLAASEVVHDCATEKAYKYALGRQLGEADACDLELLRDAFSAGGGDLHELLVEIVLSDGFRHQLAP